MINLNNMFEKLNEQHFEGKITKIPASWNNRMRTAAGYCRYKRNSFDGGYTPTSIELSSKLFENESWDIRKIERTLIHEMVHAFLLEHHNEKGHTARFQRMMTNITGEFKNHRCHTYNVSGLRNKRNIVANCPNCGVIGRRSRRPKATLVYKCTKCSSRIIWSKEDSGSFTPLF